MTSFKIIIPSVLFLCVGLSSAHAHQRNQRTKQSVPPATAVKDVKMTTKVRAALFRKIGVPSKDSNVISLEVARQSIALKNKVRSKILEVKTLNHRQKNVFVEFLYTAFKQMDVQERLLFELLYIEGKKDIEIMEEMGIPSDAFLEQAMEVRNKIEKVKKDLKLAQPSIGHYRVSFEGLYAKQLTKE